MSVTMEGNIENLSIAGGGHFSELPNRVKGALLWLMP